MPVILEMTMEIMSVPPVDIPTLMVTPTPKPETTPPVIALSSGFSEIPPTGNKLAEIEIPATTINVINVKFLPKR